MINIGVIHATAAAIPPLNDAARKCGKDVTILNFLNENLLYRANQVGGADEFGFRSFTRLFFDAVDAGVDGIIVACSVYTPFVDRMKAYAGIPVIGIDNPMLTSAVEQGRKIGIVATTAASGPSAKAQMEKIADLSGKKVEFEIGINTDAMLALKTGDVERHNALIAETGKALISKGCDSIVLAQITMACAADGLHELGVPVFTSPMEGIKKITALIEERNN